jgi:hypothetical protein
MSVESALERVAAISAALANPAMLAEGKVAALTGGTEAPAQGTAATPDSFAAALAQAGLESSGPSALQEGTSPGGSVPAGFAGVAGVPAAGGSAIGGTGLSASALAGVGGVAAPEAHGGVGAKIVAIAESQVGQEEQPPGSGSNEGPAIAMYRSATQGAVPGAPWCAYFASWVSRQAGEPLGGQGQGFGSVAQIWSWAQSVGRAIPAHPGVVPKPGDLIVFGDQHVGIVKGVRPDGSIATIEGNYENKVARNVRSASEPTGYVEMS